MCNLSGGGGGESDFLINYDKRGKKYEKSVETLCILRQPNDH